MMELAWQLATPPLQTFGDKAILLISLSLSLSTVWPLTGISAYDTAEIVCSYAC